MNTFIEVKNLLGAVLYTVQVKVPHSGGQEKGQFTFSMSLRKRSFSPQDGREIICRRACVCLFLSGSSLVPLHVREFKSFQQNHDD